MSKDLIERPKWLPAKKDAGAGTEGLGEFIIPPRLKVVQPLAHPPYDQFEKGDAVITPQLLKICDKNEGSVFHFVPIYFFAEWCLWNPIQMKQQLNAIRERTTDKEYVSEHSPGMPMYQVCRDKGKWEIPCPENNEHKCRYCEHLNFVVVPLGVPELEDTPIVMSFFRAEHTTGRNFAALIKMRKADIFACQFAAEIGHRSNNLGNWYGWNIHNPSEVSAWVDSEEKYVFYRQLHEEYKSAQVAVEYEMEGGDAAAPANDDF